MYTSKSASDWVSHGVKLEGKEHLGHYLLFYTQQINEIRPQAEFRVPTEGILSPSDSAPDCVTYGVNIVAKVHAGHYMIFYIQDFDDI